MTKDKGIFIKNIYYMLTYAFHILKQSDFCKVAAEEFDNVQDFYAAILVKGIARQVKGGFYREYKSRREEQSVFRGKLILQESLKQSAIHKKLLTCEVEELSENNKLNQILKTTIVFLLNDNSVKEQRKKELKKVILFFDQIDTIEISEISWNQIFAVRKNQNYQMMMNICYFVFGGFLQTTEKGSYKVEDFSEKQLSRLYEKFVLEYYKYHHRYLTVKATQIKWNLVGQIEEETKQILPVMRTDLTLCYQDKTLIIDTKYYAHTMQTYFETSKLYSSHLYQIFAYVKNQDIHNTGNVSGLLLYAKVGEEEKIDTTFCIGGNQISVKTLDLNTDFKVITAQLDKIVEEYFGKRM